MAVTTSAVIGIAAGAGNAVQGFVSASQAKNAAEKARGEATKLMNDARKRAEVNNYEGLNIPLDAYEAKFENNLAADRQAIEALQEGDSRALAAGVGRIGAQQNTEAQATRLDMADEMFGLNKMKADSKENIKQQMVAIDVGGATMADQIAYEEEQRRMKGLEAGMAGIGQVAEGVGDLAPLYGKSTADKRAGKMMENDKFIESMGYDPKKITYKQRQILFDRVAGSGITGKEFRAGEESGYDLYDWDFDRSLFD
tara:strand:+ start:649 stop:1413 length:765 start_codon:yes stop_codon:yes gene_type:complete